ncbi:putative bifunctional diguanylate cyclase/phosphodiesterase [Microvirga rosea]|uniref:putative bifunctional diguanylate cyclase/phosphodiesterase n=1 Tax=Microvirga rosea TaxID=2715425 RepID=UPI001D0B9F22|nr:bifunctional diguanylate cyclase/phosphodiesterase [Microvirga rosea]MCB8819783.1 EAL domain-containing protein [Microvirga rosea]
MTRTLIPRDNILALYNSSGQDTLQLLSAPADPSGTQPEPGMDVRQPGIRNRSKSAAKSGRSVKHYKGQTPDANRIAGTADQQTPGSARPDILTGLYDRRHFQDQCAELVGQARAAGHRLALILMGLDRFKDLNNAHGYKAGDEVLADIARNLNALLADGDRIGRFGGDEFALLLSSPSDESDVMSAVRGLLEAATGAMRRYMPGLKSGASAGIALFPDHGSEVDELIQSADMALDRAKIETRGQAQIFEPHMRDATLDRLGKLAGFRKAIENGEIKPFYQPQMRLSDRRSYGFEALARWVHADGRILHPADFKIALDDPDAVVLLGEHMLRSVSQDLRHWRSIGIPTCKVSVNAAAPELRRGDYAEKVASFFAANKVPLSQLTIEITESVLLDDMTSKIGRTLSDLRKLGASISLDDFGTGFASLTHLKSYAVDQIKIDRSFIVHLMTDAHDRAIVRATLSLARGLGIRTIAEGVENAAQLKSLQMLGCDYGQGYFFSPALPADQAGAYFAAHRAYQKAQLHQFVVPSVV